MDVAAECRAVEAKLRSFVYPPIFINPEVYDNADTRNFVALIRKIVNSLPIELHEILMTEAVFTPLTTFSDEQFYNVFANFINKHSKKVDKTTSYTILPFDQWKRKYFCAMKMRLVGVFVDIIKYLNKQYHYINLEQNQYLASERISAHHLELNYQNKALLEKTLRNYIIIGPEFVQVQQKMLAAIERLDAKVNDLCARVSNVEGVVKNIYVEMIK